MQQLKVFVSSTYFDLSQIRSDLYDFFISTGYSPILSEYSSFPVDPDTNTIENCIENVKATDILVLIIGSRYGYVMDSGKSITNTEYLYAKEMNIPVYVFISKALINVLPVWKKNTTADFSAVVDSAKVFEFVEEVREKNKNWCFEFERAQDITATLKIQLAHLFKDSLDIRKKYRVSDQPDFYKHLSGQALNILLHKDLLYEAAFFAQVLKDELSRHEDLKLDLEYKILTTCTREISDKQTLISWVSTNFESVSNQIASLTNLFNVFGKYFGEQGIPADLKGLFYVAKAIARIYKDMAQWSLEIKSTRVEDKYENIRDILSEFPIKTLDKIWLYPDETLYQIAEGVRLYKLDNNQPRTVQSILVMEADDSVTERFRLELEKIKRS